MLETSKTSVQAKRNINLKLLTEILWGVYAIRL